MNEQKCEMGCDSHDATHPPTAHVCVKGFAYPKMPVRLRRRAMLRRALLGMLLIMAIVELSAPVKLFHNRQDEEQVPASVVWIHSDVYEMNFLKDGVAHVCTVISKGDDLLVTIEIREPTKEPMTKGDKPETIVINGKIHRFKLNKKDGRMSEVVWMLYGETDKGLRFTNSVKSGPSTKRMLEPFKEVLAKLPTEICELLEKILR